MAKFKIGQNVQISPYASVPLMKQYASPLESIGRRGIIIDSKYNPNFSQQCYQIDVIGGRKGWWYLKSVLTNHKTLNDLVINP